MEAEEPIQSRGEPQLPDNGRPRAVIAAGLPERLRRFVALTRSFVRRLTYAIWSVFRSLAISLYEETLYRMERLSFFQLVLRLLILIVGVSVIQEICNDSPVLEVLNLPREFQDQGYTPDVVARRIKDRITEIDKAEEGNARHRPFELAADSPLPDLQLPEANVSLKTAILFVRQLLHFSPDRITVDVTLDLPTDDKNPSSNTTGSKRLDTQLRVVVRRFPGNQVAPTPEPITATNLEQTLSPLAQAVMAETDPYVLGVYVRDNKGPKASEPYFRKAAELEKRATELNPGDSNAYRSWGNALYSQGEFADASAKYKTASELNPSDPDVYNNWGNALAYQGKFAEAYAMYEKATQLKPEFSVAYNDWGSALDDQGKFVEANAKYQKATKLAPDFADAYFNWGQCALPSG